MTVLAMPSKNRNKNQIVTSLKTAISISKTAARHKLKTHTNQAPKRLASGGMNGDEAMMPSGVIAAFRPIMPGLNPMPSRISANSG